MSEAEEEIKATITVSTDGGGVGKSREDEKEQVARDPMTRTDTISMLKKDSRDTHVLGKCHIHDQNRYHLYAEERL